MAQRNRFSNQRQKARTRTAPPAPAFRQPVVLEKKPIIVYGKAFIVMEDEQKHTFIYKGASWAPHTMSIAEYKQDCQVKELPQKVNRMIRYEIRCPVPTDA